MQIDLVSHAELKSVRRRIAAINGAAELIDCQLRPSEGGVRARFPYSVLYYI